MIKEEAVNVAMVEEQDPAAAADAMNPTNGGFEAASAMEEEQEANINKDNLWLDGINDASIFYDDFPPLPDFPCMSSSSSSSSAPALVKPTSTSHSSSSASSSVMKSNPSAGEENNQMVTEHATLRSTASMDIPLPLDQDGGVDDCIDVMENLGYLDLIDSYDIWDPSSVFDGTENPSPQEFMIGGDQPEMMQQQGSQQMMICGEEEENHGNGGFDFIEGNGELALIFLEWLKQNKDHISAEEMRKIKLKRSTIENASKRLGTTKEGKKLLLKLILQWVEQHQLQKRKDQINGQQSSQFANNIYQETHVVQNPDFICTNPNPTSTLTYATNFVSPDPNTCYPATPWMVPTPAAPAPQIPDAATAMVVPPPAYSFPVAGYGNGADPYFNPMFVPPFNQVVNGIPCPNQGDYSMMDNTQAWAPTTFSMPPPPPLPQFSPFCDGGGNIVPYQQAFYGNPYPPIIDPNGERIVRLGSSATKEARKKRMARQRRHYTHHHRHNSSSYQQQGQMVEDSQMITEGGENCEQGEGDWAYWSPGASPSPSRAGITPPHDASQPQSGDRTPVQLQGNQRSSAADRRQQQSWRTEKNLKFLLQKVLKQSDVGNLGRIVLPKKEAESHLPELESRDGIPIAMEDIGTSRVWNMRYRFWPNNKSRMYLLENTGDFVKVNGLQEGDFIVIYSDTKCGKYMIRGVKVRQPGAKTEGKKMSRRNARSLSFAGNSSLAPIRQAVRGI